jgi:class 3 adenylate cyclase
MGPGSLFLKDPSASRFLSGGLVEVETLLGAPRPFLPPPEMDGGKPVYYVRFHPRLRALLQKYLHGLLLQIGLPGASLPSVRPESFSKDQGEYEAALASVLRSVRRTDRRMGLQNLFWLAHSRDVVECLKELEGKVAGVRKLKYSLHPILSSFYREAAEASVREDFRGTNDNHLGPPGAGKDSTSLVDSVIDDGFCFTESTINEFDFNQFLASNKRYRIAADLFFEIYQVLIRETERKVREQDRGMLARIAKVMPGYTRDQPPSSVVKLMMSAPVMTYLFADAWGTGAKLLAAAKVKAEVERRKGSEILDAFLDLVTNVKRFEILSHIRDQIVLLQAFAGDHNLDERVRSGARIYEFGESAQVVNNALNATVLFLDLRGFTRTSEGQISEGDLTRELYTVFDAFTPHVRRFGGTIDKFLGDGMMVTFGTVHSDPLDPLNAVRAAILCQAALSKLREEQRTYFKMGISIHYGRAYLARFIAEDDSVQTTVIGRNVNLAGRLSSGAKQPMDEDVAQASPAGPQAPARASGLLVTVDGAGSLFNEGIAISRETLLQLEAHLALDHVGEDKGTRIEYFDEEISRRIVIRYAGDAKFKGVRSSLPVYEVDYEG